MNKRPEPAGAVLWRVLHVAHELEGRIESALSQVDLSLPKLGVLRILADAKEPLPLSQLAEHSRCVRSNMTQLVDRLEADGLVRRVNDDADRRVRRAALTAAGRKACDRGTRIVQTFERATTDALSPGDAAALSQALGQLGR
jgi:DNA-binding MarR family transcriptional regulator